MRIVIVASLARSLINFRGPLIKALCDTGAEVHAVAPGLRADLATSSQLQGWGVKTHDIELQRTGINPFKDFSTLFSFYRIFRHIKPDAILSYTIKPVIYGSIAARLAKIPKRYALITGLGYAFAGDARGKRALILSLVSVFYHVALKRAELIFFQNPDDEALFRRLNLIEPEVRSKVVNGSGIDTSYFSPPFLDSSRPSFLLIARLIGDKGVREYVAAAASIRQRHPQVLCRLVGYIDENPDSIRSQELEEWVASGTIEYLGALEDVRPAIADSNVYVLPSYYREGIPRSILEAMAMGRAIITTDAPGCRETVVEGENGFLVSVKSVESLVLAMEKFIFNTELTALMGQRSREIAVEKYDVHKVNKVMLKEMDIR